MNDYANKTKITPQDVFFQLLSFVTLIITVSSIIALLFQYINAIFPDQLDNYYRYTQIYNVMRIAISSLLVVWPVYIITKWLIRKHEKKEPVKLELVIKKWLTYLILFAAAITIIIDLITLINNFLGGELTIHFFLKILVVFFSAGIIFGYYIWELKKSSLTSRLPVISVLVISILLLVAIIYGFFVIGTPSEQRARKFDEKRIDNLHNIQFQVVNYWNKKGFLPKDLNVLTDDLKGWQVPVDPLTNKEYYYQIKEKLIFELCAEFQTKSEQEQITGKKIKPYLFIDDENWEHGLGKQCFERTIDPELHSDNNLPIVPLPVRSVD